MSEIQKTKVFISWSGDASREVAAHLARLLPTLNHLLDPFFSPDLDKGTEWFPTIADAIASRGHAIFIVTKENIRSPWLQWELGGAMAMTRSTGAEYRVCPLLIALSPGDLSGTPLPLLQTTSADKREDFARMLAGLDSGTDVPAGDAVLDRRLDPEWEAFEEIVASAAAVGRRTEVSGGTSTTSDDDVRTMMEEMIGILRRQERSRGTHVPRRDEIESMFERTSLNEALEMELQVAGSNIPDGLATVLGQWPPVPLNQIVIRRWIGEHLDGEQAARAERMARDWIFSDLPSNGG